MQLNPIDFIEQEFADASQYQNADTERLLKEICELVEENDYDALNKFKKLEMLLRNFNFDDILKQIRSEFRSI